MCDCFGIILIIWEIILIVKDNLISYICGKEITLVMLAIRKILLAMCLAVVSSSIVTAQSTLFVSPSGNDRSEGDLEHPVRTIGAALDRVCSLEGDVIVYLRGGRYVIDRTMTVKKSAIGDKRLTIASYDGEPVTVTAAVPMDLKWKRLDGCVWKAKCDIPLDRLIVNGRSRILARFPDWTPDVLFNGTSADALSKERISRWEHPEGGYIHSMHSGMWGSQHYVITGRIDDSLSFVGGNQVSRPSPIHTQLRYVENIREELDSPGEWYWSKSDKELLYYPLPEENPRTSTFEAVCLKEMLVFEGNGTDDPITGLTIEGIRFESTARTFMLPYETLMRSDWGIYRGGAIRITDSEGCTIRNCEFADLGSNAVFVSGYACRDTISGNHFHDIGGSAICLVGNTEVVRSGSFGYSEYVVYDKLDKTPGPCGQSYPRHCLVEDNLIHDLGTVEKQVAGVEIQIASENVVRHNTIFDVPRAGINIGDGAFGGHIIEYNDVFDTVLETSDHGAFNSWGRDRFWLPSRSDMNNLVEAHPEIILLDAMKTTVIRFNRFRCDHGWDIDLDDGSSNYHIYGNLCLHGGIKLREGFYRKVENNFVINNTLHPHVWFNDSHDVVIRNIFMRPYAPVLMKAWGDELDYNFFAGWRPGKGLANAGTDTHSRWGEVSFVDPQSGDYTLLSCFEASDLGIENIPMDKFGVYSPRLRQYARKPEFSSPTVFKVDKDQKVYSWLGASVKSVSGMGDRSAFGLPDEKGVIVLDVVDDSPASKAGIIQGDVIRSFDESEAADAESLMSMTENHSGEIKIGIIRYQKQITKKIWVSH